MREPLVSDVNEAAVRRSPRMSQIAIAIALLKMLLILLFFMHVRYSNRLTWIFAGAGFVWLAILIGLTLNDYRTR